MAASIEYHLTVHTQNGEQIRVAFTLGFGRLEQIYHEEIYEAYYSPVHQCASEWAQRYEDAASLASDDDHLQLLQDQLLSIPETTYASVGRVLNHEPTPKPSSPIDDLDRTASLLHALHEWVQESKYKYPFLWKGRQNRQLLKIAIDDLRRKIMGRRTRV